MILSSTEGSEMPQLTDEQWKKIAPLLPPQKPSTGRPGADLRTIISGLVWIHMHPNKPWRKLPREYGPWSTVANCYYRWRKSGVWERINSALEEVLAHE